MLRQAVPGAGVSLILDTLRRTGLPITDTRPPGAGTTVPRVSVFDALQSLKPVSNPYPRLTSVEPEPVARRRAVAGDADVDRSNFNAFSVAYWNGVAKPTTVLSTTQLQATIPITDLATVGTVPVWVATPAPGGGTLRGRHSHARPAAEPHRERRARSRRPQVTTTLANGFGGANDWLALAATGSPLTSYISFTYVGSGVTSRTLDGHDAVGAGTVRVPTVPEQRLHARGGRARSSPSTPRSILRLPSPRCLRPAFLPVRAAFTLTVNGTGFVASSVVRWNGASRQHDVRQRDTAAGRDLRRRHRSVGIEQCFGRRARTGRRHIGQRAFNATPPPALSVSSTTAHPAEASPRR